MMSIEAEWEELNDYIEELENRRDTESFTEAEEALVLALQRQRYQAGLALGEDI